MMVHVFLTPKVECGRPVARVLLVRSVKKLPRCGAKVGASTLTQALQRGARTNHPTASLAFLLSLRRGPPVASLFLVAMPGAPSSFLLLVAMHLLLLAMPLAPSSFLYLVNGVCGEKSQRCRAMDHFLGRIALHGEAMRRVDSYIPRQPASQKTGQPCGQLGKISQCRDSANLTYKVYPSK